MGLIVAIWGIAFGPISRRFEWQADLFGAMSVTPDVQQCKLPCRIHGTVVGDEDDDSIARDSGNSVVADGIAKPTAICATAAENFGEALHRIAVLNGIPVESRSWRHSSIGNRIRRLRSYATDPATIAHLNREVAWIKGILIVGTVVSLAIGAYLYWPTQLIEQWLRTKGH